MVDEEAISVSGARKYSLTTGYGQSFRFAGSYDERRSGPPPRVVAIDAVRGGGPSMTRPALLRDMNKARIAFEGATELATGHWGCGAFGNNHDLMFLKQWLAASEAGVRAMYYHDFSRSQSHHILPLVRRCQHLTVGQLWAFVLELTCDLQPCNMPVFCRRIADIAVDKLKVPRGAALGGNGGCAAAPWQAGVCCGPWQAGGAAPGPQRLVEAEVVRRPVGTASDHVNADDVPASVAAAEPTRVFSLAELQSGLPVGVDALRKENYLSPADFEGVFGMAVADFAKVPKWRRDGEKKRAGLF
jgi:hypothetical protein